MHQTQISKTMNKITSILSATVSLSLFSTVADAQVENGVWNVTEMRAIFYSGPSFSHEGAYDFNLHFNAPASNDWYPEITFDAFMPEPALTAGTYTLSAGQLKEIRAARNGSDWGAYVSAMTLQITDNGNGNFTFDADMTIGGETNTFSYTCDVDVQVDDYDPYVYAYGFESREASQIEFVADQISWNDIALHSQKQIEIDMTSNTCSLANTVKICVNTETGVLPAGDYPIRGYNDALNGYELGTVLQSVGSYDNYSLFPSYVAMMDEDHVAEAAWFMLDGAMTIAYPAEGQIRIELNATSAFGSDLHVIYEGAFDYTEHVATTLEVALDTQAYFLDCTYYNHLTFTGNDQDGKLVTAMLDIFAPSFVGTFSTANQTINQWQSGVIDENGRGYNLTDGTATITATDIEGVYNVDATLVADNGDTYILHGEGIHIDNGCYNLDEEIAFDGTFHTNLNGIDAWDADYNGTIYLQCTNDEGQGITLKFKVNGADAETIIPIGTYTIDDSDMVGTVLASPGQTGMEIMPSYAANCDPYFQIDNVWFIVSGTVTVTSDEDNIYVAVSAKNTLGQNVNATITIAKERNIEYDENFAFEASWSSNDILLEDHVADLGTILLSGFNAGHTETAVLQFNVNDWDDVIGIPAGVYTIDDSGLNGTVSASTGFDFSFNATPSFASYCTPSGFLSRLWFLIDGTVTVANVNDQPRIEVNATNSYHRPVHILIEPDHTTSLNNVRVQMSEGKHMINGRLVINRQGLLFDAQGHRIVK